MRFSDAQVQDWAFDDPESNAGSNENANARSQSGSRSSGAHPRPHSESDHNASSDQTSTSMDTTTSMVSGESTPSVSTDKGADPNPSQVTLDLTASPETFAEVDGTMYKFTDQGTFVQTKQHGWVKLTQPNNAAAVTTASATTPTSGRSLPTSGWAAVNAQDMVSGPRVANTPATQFSAWSQEFFKEANSLIAQLQSKMAAFSKRLNSVTEPIPSTSSMELGQPSTQHQIPVLSNPQFGQPQGTDQRVIAKRLYAHVPLSVHEKKALAQFVELYQMLFDH